MASHFATYRLHLSDSIDPASAEIARRKFDRWAMGLDQVLVLPDGAAVHLVASDQPGAEVGGHLPDRTQFGADQ